MPDWKELVRDRLSGLNLVPARESEIGEELADHLDQRYGELLAAELVRPKPPAWRWKNWRPASRWQGVSKREFEETSWRAIGTIGELQFA